MHSEIKVQNEIRNLAYGTFDKGLIVQFIETVIFLLRNTEIKGYFLQISKDEGNELEIGFFTENEITDVTLSRGKIYSCQYPLTSIREIKISKFDHKHTLTIVGEKKFDYNILESEPTELLEKYKSALQAMLAVNPLN